MKLAKLLTIIKPFLAADKKPEDVERAVLAATDGLPGNVGSSKEIEDKRAKDRKARDEKCAIDRAAKDKAFDEFVTKAKDKRAADRAARDSARDAARTARDAKFGKDRDDDPENTNDADVLAACDADMGAEDAAESAAEKKAEDEDYMQGSDPSTPGGNRAGGKTAVDSADVDARIAIAVAAARAEDTALRTALDDVAPVLGKVAFDSAPKAYRAALAHLKIDHKDVPDAGLSAVLRVARAGASAPAAPTMDSANAMGSAIPGYNRLK